MKRSEINRIIREADTFIREHRFSLPPFAHWTPQDWHDRGEDARAIVEHQLGWDITDFGSGDYAKCGLFLFTVRNGHPDNLKTLQGPLYAEKLLIVLEGQLTPFHFHWHKTEDIINRGGGTLVLELYNSGPDGETLGTGVAVLTDGVRRTVSAGGRVSLKPGESITLPTGLYHQFWAERGTVLVGEVSNVNNDHLDNRFLTPVGRFPEIEEDEEPFRLLYNDYPRFYRFAGKREQGGY